MTKIALIGAGSVVFAKTLVNDILHSPALSDSTICLMDINPQRLAVSEQLMKRMVAQMKAKARIEATLDLRTACKGARFVITTIQVGGYKPSTVIDFEIPAKYGLQQTIADTLGVGGVFRALRSIPELVKVARTMQEVSAPDSLLLNYTNPMAMNMWAIDRMTGQKAVGLCHSVQGTSHQLASYCGFDYKDVNYLVAGINHMAFFLRFEYKGKDAYPFLFRALEQEAIVSLDRVRFEMMRRLGYFVTESSEHQAEYNPYFIHHGEEYQKKFAVPINEYIRRCEMINERWKQQEEDMLDPDKPVEIRPRSVEYGSTIMHSIISGEPSVIYGNVPNTHLITNLPYRCCVEVPCLVDKQGLSPVHIGDLPPQLAAIIRTNVNVQELAVEAAATGRREYIYQAVMADPHTATVLTLDKIWAMCDELIEAHQKTGYLGEFKPVFRDTGRSLASLARVFLRLEAEGIPFYNGATEATFHLVAENELGRDFEGEVGIEIEGDSFSPVAPLQVKVAAGETVRIPFRVSRVKPVTGAVKFSIASPSVETVEKDFTFVEYEKIEVPVDPSGKERYRFSIDWTGNRLADCSIWLSDDRLFFEAFVDDTDVKCEKRIFGDGSDFVLFVKNPQLPNEPAVGAFVYPDPVSPAVTTFERFCRAPEFPGATVAVEAGAEGYRATVSVPLKELKISADCPFLMDVHIHVNALGTAHGKVGATWRDGGAFGTNLEKYALLAPVKR